MLAVKEQWLQVCAERDRWRAEVESSVEQRRAVEKELAALREGTQRDRQPGLNADKVSQPIVVLVASYTQLASIGAIV